MELVANIDSDASAFRGHKKIKEHAKASTIPAILQPQGSSRQTDVVRVSLMRIRKMPDLGCLSILKSLK